MYIAKKILVKATISLFAGIASAIGAKAGSVLWDECIGNKITRGYKESFS